MIGYLNGTIKFLFDDSCILDVNGVGYKIFVDTQTLQTLTVGVAAEFFIHTAVREDSITLFGMANRATFELFEMLLTVSGVGAKSALAIVSKISPADFARAIALQDVKSLTRLPGVGKKSAERILLELKGKIGNQWSEVSVQDVPNAQVDAAEALSALGYTSEEIADAFRRAPKNSTTEQLIKFALTELNRFA